MDYTFIAVYSKILNQELHLLPFRVDLKNVEENVNDAALSELVTEHEMVDFLARFELNETLNRALIRHPEFTFRGGQTTLTLFPFDEDIQCDVVYVADRLKMQAVLNSKVISAQELIDYRESPHSTIGTYSDTVTGWLRDKKLVIGTFTLQDPNYKIDFIHPEVFEFGLLKSHLVDLDMSIKNLLGFTCFSNSLPQDKDTIAALLGVE